MKSSEIWLFYYFLNVAISVFFAFRIPRTNAWTANFMAAFMFLMIATYSYSGGD